MSHRHLMSRMRRSAAGDLSLDWQDFSHRDKPLGPVADRMPETGERWHRQQAITEVGDHVTVVNSRDHPYGFGYTILSQEDLDDPSGIKFLDGGGWEPREPLGAYGHEKDEKPFGSPEEAMAAAEKHYFSLDHASRPSYHRAPQDSGVDYDKIFNDQRPPLDDDFGDIFGGDR